MISAAGHTLQLGEQVVQDRRSGASLTRVTLECTCGACFVDALVAVNPSGSDLARIRAKGWAASQVHLHQAESGKAGKRESEANNEVSEPARNPKA